MSHIVFSNNESQHLGLRIGRSGRKNHLDVNAVWKEIKSGKFDWVKLKPELSEKAIFQQIESLPCFSEPFNIIALQKATPQFIALPNDANLSFECYDGSQRAEVSAVLLDILGEDTNLYYQSDIYDAVMSSSKQKDTSIAYYLTMNHAEDASKFLFIGRDSSGEPMGVCSFIKTSDREAEGVIYGVRPKFRSRQLAGLFLQHSLNTLAEVGVETFFTEVQYYNFRSLYPHLKSGFKPAGLYINLNLFPFLGQEIAEFTCAGKNVSEAITECIHDITGQNRMLRWTGVRGNAALLNEHLISARLVICTDKLSLVALRSGHQICYLKLEHLDA